MSEPRGLRHVAACPFEELREYAEAQRSVWDDAPWIFLWSPSFVLVHSARLKGIVALPTEKFSVAYAEAV